MAAQRLNNKELLKAYKLELAEVRDQLSRLSGRHSALINVVRGLEQLEGGPQPVEEAEKARETSQPRARISDGERTIAAMAAAALRKLPKPKNQGVADVRKLLASNGRLLTYSALYVAMKREAAKPHGLLVKRGKKFGLREWKEEPGT